MSRKIFRTYILRLLAGKFGPICTEFPLSSFLAKILTRLPLKFRAKKIEVNANFLTCKKNKHSSENFISFKRNSDSTMSSLAFLIYDSLHEMMYGSCKRKSILASYREPNQNWIFQSNLYASSYQPIF